jgi:prepilin-type N-terminal cleavage/methylation domain-containing protein
MSLIELLVALAVFAVALGIAVPRVQNGAFALWNAEQLVLGDLRYTRAQALTKGDHFVFQVDNDNTYSIRRMELNGAVWEPEDPPIRSRSLPSGVIFTAGFAAGVGANFEFNTRGLLVLPGAAQSLRLYDDYTMLTRQITVWPSGQVAPI